MSVLLVSEPLGPEPALVPLTTRHLGPPWPLLDIQDPPASAVSAARLNCRPAGRSKQPPTCMYSTDARRLNAESMVKAKVKEVYLHDVGE